MGSEQAGGATDGIAVQRQRIGALFVDVGRKQLCERIEQPFGLSADHAVELGDQSIVDHTGRRSDVEHDPTHPVGSDPIGDAQQLGSRFGELNVAHHVLSSIVSGVLRLCQRLVAHAARRSIAAVMTVTMLAACTGDGDADPAASTTMPANTTTTVVERPNDGVLKIGIFLPRTGPGATLGEPMIAAAEAAIESINDAGGVLGREIEHETVDEGAGTGPDDLLTAGVDAIVGPASSNVALSQLAAVVQPSTGVVTCSPMATALALDDYPDNNLFFRTAPSDSLQMAAVARQARITGVTRVAVGYLDDPYGRGLVSAFANEMQRREAPVVAEVGFGGDQEDLTEAVATLLANEPGVVVVLGDADDGSRLLAALDATEGSASVSQFIVNDAIRAARPTIQALSTDFRQRLTGVAPAADAVSSDGPEGFFTAHAVDCVNLIALSALSAGSDDPTVFRAKMSAVGSGGRECSSFADCTQLLGQGLDINYEGVSGSVELSNSAGDPVRARFESFGFDADAIEVDPVEFEVSF